MMRKIVLFFLFLFLIVSVYPKNVIVVRKADNTVAVIYPVKNAPLDEIYQEATGNTDLEGLLYVIMDDSKLPSRDDRNFWEWDGSSVEKKVKVNNIKKQATKDAETKKEQDKVNAKSKLKALGLTDDEINTLIK